MRGSSMESEFNAVSGLKALKTDEVRDKASGVVREKLFSAEFADDMPSFLTSRQHIYPRVMDELLSNEEAFSTLQARLQQLGLDDLMTFCCCGEDSLIFNLGAAGEERSGYVVRISKA